MKKSILKNIQTLIFTDKSFLYKNSGFTQSHSNPLNDINGYYQLIARSYKSNKPIDNIGTDKIQLKYDCINGSFVNGFQEPILYKFAHDQPPSQKNFKEPRIRPFKKVNKSVLSHITFHNEDDDHKPVDFNGETIRFVCQLIKK